MSEALRLANRLDLWDDQGDLLEAAWYNESEAHKARAALAKWKASK